MFTGSLSLSLTLFLPLKDVASFSKLRLVPHDKYSSAKKEQRELSRSNAVCAVGAVGSLSAFSH